MNQETALKSENPMRSIRLEKVTLNAGTGGDMQKLEKYKAILEKVTGRKSMTVITSKRTTFGVPKKKPISAMVTVRGRSARELLERLLHAVENKLKVSQFDSQGNFSFGVAEYINIPGIKYDADIGILGFDVAVTLERPGFRVKRRRLRRRSIGKDHMITREEAMEWARKNFNAKVIEKEE